MGIIPTLGAGLATSLPAWPWCSIGAGGAFGGGGGVGLASEELLWEETDAGLELLVLVVEEVLALDGPLMPGLPVGGLASGLELLGQTWADRARSLGYGRGRTGRGLLGPGQERGRRSVRPGGRGMLHRHVARCSRGRTRKPESRTGLPYFPHISFAISLNFGWSVWGFRSHRRPACPAVAAPFVEASSTP